MKFDLKKFIKTEKFRVLFLAIVSIAVILPIFFNGLPSGSDMPHHYQCAATFVDSIRDGEFYPSWSLNRNLGFGGMETRLYPPLSHYILALAYLGIGDWLIASWLIFTILAFLGSLGAYLWARETMSAEQAVFAGCIYALVPYHLNQLYNTFFYAEYAAAAVLPFTFFFVSRVCRRGKLIDVLGLAIAYAALILTHLPMTVIGSICFAIYGLTLLKREKLFPQLTKLTAGAIFGAAASSFFWIKVLLERDLMAKTGVYPEPIFDYRINFLLTGIQNFSGDALTVFENGTYFYDIMLFFTLLTVIACTLPFFITARKIELKDKGIWLVLGFSVFMTLPFSKFVWNASGSLQEVQFPWRFLAIISITASIVSASQINHLPEWFKTTKRPLALIVSGCLLAAIAFSVGQIIRPTRYLEKPYVADFMKNNESKIGLEFWWTIWTRREFAKNTQKAAANDRTIQISKWTATEKEFQISEGTSNQARVGVFYHPNWNAEIDGSPVEIKPDETGAILIPITNQTSRVRLIFQENIKVKTARQISLFIWLCLLGLLLFQLKAQIIKSFLPFKMSE